MGLEWLATMFAYVYLLEIDMVLKYLPMDVPETEITTFCFTGRSLAWMTKDGHRLMQPYPSHVSDHIDGQSKLLVALQLKHRQLDPLFVSWFFG